ncbi:MAG: hypothetical protein K2L82_11105 [Lachnospiraceae bacterium]|nr:hypothetical protein [Lachnospiraceae bacterium]
MNILSRIKIPKGVLVGIVFIIMIVVFAVATKLLAKDKQEVTEYDYTAAEQQIADEVIRYLNEQAEIPENIAADIANVAVENYRIVLRSDVDMVKDDHTEAIEQHIRTALNEYLPDDSSLSENDKNGVAAGIAEIVWNAILRQIQTVTETKNMDFENEYYFLAESIQGQIDKLEERKMKVSIQANIKSNQAKDMTADELLSMIEGMTDDEIRELLKTLGLSYDEFYDLIASANKDIDQDLDERLKKLREELEKELAKDIKSELEKQFSNSTSNTSTNTNGRDGKSGTDGRDGQDGKDGKDGEDGKAGKDGMSIFIMYSATSSGDNMTDVPTEDTKYMGTYTGTSASSNPADYTWTRYSDATITYSDGTLYITQ